MKEGWEYKKLGEVCDILNGFAFKSSTYVADGIRVIRISNVQKGKVEDKDPKFFPLSSKSEIENYLLNEGDLLISLTGNVGRVGILLRDLLPAALNQRVACLRLNNNNIDKRYLFHFLNSDYFESICIKNSKGAAQLNMSTVWLSNYAIPVPPLSEQQRIVDYLDTAFTKIDAMKANAEKALNEAKALFQASLKEMLEPKEGWEEKKFGKICDFVRGPFGGSLKKECFKDSGYAVYEQQNAIYNKFSFRYFIDEEKYNSLIRFKVNAGDLIMSCSGTIGKVAIIPETFKEGIINQALLKLTPNKDIDAHFLKYLMESNLFKEIINANIEGVAIKNIASVAVLKEIKLYIPKVSEQQKIVVEIDSLKSKVDRLQANFEKISQECDALKQALLREVFEG